MPRLPTRVFRIAHGVHAGVSAARRRARRAVGVARPLRIVPYRGFGTAARAWVKARVLEDRGEVEPRDRRGLVGSAVASYRRFATAEVPGARVRIRWDAATWETQTDAEGFVDLAVAPPPSAEPGWNDVSLTFADEEGQGAVASVQLVGDGSRFGVVTDVDDTIIVTGVKNLAKRAWALFMPEAAGRRPFPGVAAFYGALARGDGDAENPIFYVSSSPWNIHGHVEHFLETHGLPRGPILLRDWGLTTEGFAPDGRHEHKLDKIRSIVDAHPELPFVLFGDSGQHDAEHYATIARERPGRVTCIYIRNVPSKAGRAAHLAEIAAGLDGSGTELVAFDKTVEAALDASRRGLVPEETVERTRADVE